MHMVSCLLSVVLKSPAHLFLVSDVAQKPMLTVRFVVDLKARGARCCAVARGQACCPTVLALLLPRRWPALRACSLADKDAYIFVYYGISPNLVGGKGGGALGSGFDPTCW
jgi:hypothetical protein